MGLSGRLLVETLLPLNVSFVMIELLVFLPAHVVDSVVAVLVHRLHELLQIHVLLVGHLLEASLHLLQPQLLHADPRPLLGTFRLTDLG